MAKRKFEPSKGTAVDLDKLLEEKLTAMLGSKIEDDFETIEEQPKAKKRSIPKIGKKKKIKKIEEKRLVLDDPDDIEEFDEILLDWDTNRAQENKAKKVVKDRREQILTVMGDNLVYAGECADINIKETPQAAVNAEAVIEGLIDLESNDIDDLKDGVQQLLDLARMGIMNFGKTDFDKWMTKQGHNPEPFHVPKKSKKMFKVTRK